jgi:hypothetical protein
VSREVKVVTNCALSRLILFEQVSLYRSDLVLHIGDALMSC